ncbi:putative anion transporter ATPase [Mycobacterium avium subsp. avium 2285 (R)]|nr:putative anion transporter ATPase [Mycobacterium avium subsp. avium 2285 (R)]
MAAEAARTLGSLALMGVRVEELIVNQVLLQDDSYEYRNLPEHPAFYWYTERIAEQQSVLEELDAAIGEVALVLTPHLSGEPIGPKALGRCSTPPGAGAGRAARPAAAHRGPGIRDGTWVDLPDAASVAATRPVGADVGPGRRRPDHQRRRVAAQGEVGVGAAAVHGAGCASAGQRADGAFSTRSGGVA